MSDDDHAADERWKEGARAESAARRVLVVEDELVVPLQVEDTLRRAGYHVVDLAGTVAKAERLATAKPPDAAVLDVDLRGERAFPVADALTARGVPFAFLTAQGTAVLPERYRDRPFVTKPHPDRSLSDALAEAVAAARG